MRQPLKFWQAHSSGKRQLVTLLTALFCVALAAALVLAAYVGSVLYIKRFGIQLTPSKDHPVSVQRFNLQNDPRWSDEAIGASARQMGSTGCLVTSVSTAISNMGIPIDPKELNRRLSANGGYDGADLLWYKIRAVVPGVDYHYQRIFTSRTIEDDLDAGRMPIVNVKFHQTGYTHWVLIAGARDGDFLILDPLGDGHTPMRLAEHGKVYAYRVIRKAD